VIAEAQLFGPARQSGGASVPRIRKRSCATSRTNPGAPVVHEEYGVGRYAASCQWTSRQPGVLAEYQDGDRIYVPVHALHLVSRYTGAAPEARRCTNSAPISGRPQRAAEQTATSQPNPRSVARRKAQQGLALR